MVSFFKLQEVVSAESRQKLNTNSSLCNKYISYLVSGLIVRNVVSVSLIKGPLTYFLGCVAKDVMVK